MYIRIYTYIYIYILYIKAMGKKFRPPPTAPRYGCCYHFVHDLHRIICSLSLSLSVCLYFIGRHPSQSCICLCISIYIFISTSNNRYTHM